MIRFVPVRAEESIRFGQLQPEMVEVLRQAAIWSARQGREVWVRSWNDHTHGERSLHDEDLALDLSVPQLVRGLRTVPQNGQMIAEGRTILRSLSNHLKSVLGLGYDIVYGTGDHLNHIHIEWDVRQR